jgi:hypothetical protein
MNLDDKQAEYRASLESIRAQRKQCIELINKLDVDAFRLEGAIAAIDELKPKDQDAATTPVENPA